MAMEKNFRASTSEAAISARWEAAGAFAAGKHVPNDEDRHFSIMIPPPNVTGSLHMGHAFNNTLQDILVRWHRMRGFDTLWQPGQDHAGIATQMVVERQLAADQQPSRAEMGREAFLEKVWEWKDKSGDTIINQLKRLGASCDWDRNRFTMDPGFHDAVLKVFVEMYNKGLIYRGKRLVNWDPHFETAISDLEVENIEVAGHMWHFKYPLAGGATYTYVEKDEDGNVTLEEVRDYISIATTRPETMLGDGAVAVHPSDERYAPIVGTLCEIPVGPKESRRLIPIITDEYPDPEFGSGAVKITGAHDFNDYGVAKRNGIPCYRLMDTKAAMRDDGVPYAQAAEVAMAVATGRTALSEAESDALNLVPDELRGLDRFEARKRVIADITAESLAVMVSNPDYDAEREADPARSVGSLPTIPLVENKPVMQPFGDRSKVVIEPMLTDQWFVDAEKIVEPALDAVREGRTQILPERDKKVYFHWLENIEPWCISRQLWWGHQIPVWYDADGNEFCAATEDEAKAMAGGKALTRDPDVLDTWFSSGLWPIGTLGWPEQTPELERYFPTSVLITGFDIIFFWVARMMMMQLAVVEKEPFHTVYVHALVRDESGKKMSKSLGNVLDPLELIDEYGADAVRFTVTAMAAMGRDLKLSTSRIVGYRNFGTKLWNAARFAEFNEATPVEGFDPATVQQTLNKWIVGETARTLEAVDQALTQYRFNDAASTLYAFVWGKVCDWYVELSKPLFQGEDAAAKAETAATLAWVIDQCLIMLHPIMPFITEQLWGDITKRDTMLIHTAWPTYKSTDLVDSAAELEMNWVVGVIEQIRSVRSEMGVNAGAKIPLVILGLDEQAKTAFNNNAVMIQRLARIDNVVTADAAPKGAVTLAVQGGTLCLPLADVIDLDAEKARLNKTLDKLNKDITATEGRLSNERFVANAPPEVIDENRARVVAWTEDTVKVRAALDRLDQLG
jgi:valyl-tRNA synthetase